MRSLRLEPVTPLSIQATTGRRAWPLAAIVQALVLVLVTANLGRIPVVSTGDREAPILINDFAVILMVWVGAAACLSARTMRIDRVTAAALLFAALGGLSAVAHARTFGLSSFELAISLAFLARWLMYFAIYVVVINVVRRSDAQAVWSAVEATLLIIAGFGIIQAAFLPGFAQMVYPDSRAYIDWDIQGHRLVSTILEPNIAGAMLLIGLLVQLGQLSVGVRVKRWKPLVLFVALVLTLSRSAALGLVAGVGTILIARGLSKRLLRWIVVIALLVAAALPKLIAFGMAYGKFSTSGSAAARLISWARAWQVFRDSPWFGVGFNTYGYVQEHYGYDRLGGATYSSDGGLLFIAVMTGVIGLAVYLVMLGNVVAGCRRVWRDVEAPPEERGLAIGATAVAVALCVDSLFVNSMMTTFVMELMWIVFGLAACVGAGAHGRRAATRISATATLGFAGGAG